MANSSRTKRKSKKNRPLTPKRFPKLLFFARTITCLFLILAGVVFLFAANRRFLALSQKIDSPNQAEISTQKSQFSEKPAKLYIPKLSKVLPVSDGEAIGDHWVISETGVSYLTTSVLPGKVGNSVIYGHNKAAILGGMPRLVAGDLVYVVLGSGEFAKYQVFETKEVRPNQVEILNNSDEARLTIYTCTGFLDQARFVVVGKLIENNI